MALLHATQFYAGNVTAINPAFTTVYTVPAGDRIILRSIAFRNLLGGGAVTVYVKIAGVLVYTKNLGNGGSDTGSAEWRPWIVLTPGQTISVAGTNAAGEGVIVSGSLYTI